MKKTILALAAIAILILSVALAANQNDRPVVIPKNAIKISPNVYYLGRAMDNGRLVEGYAIVKYKDKHVKPGTECGNGICEPGENANKCPADCTELPDPEPSTCYAFIGNGVKWRAIESYVVNPDNNENLNATFITENLALDISKWEQAAGTDILGEGTSTSEQLEVDMVSTDGRNEVYFGSIADEGAIAVTIIWGVFGGPPPFRQIVEWDQVYDQEDFDWSASGELNKMDFENIATHELGHSVGLDDLYDSACSDQTMYGYASNGDTNKRSLEAGDILGVSLLYG